LCFCHTRLFATILHPHIWGLPREFLMSQLFCFIHFILSFFYHCLFAFHNWRG
jgi:hypothetical protein